MKINIMIFLVGMTLGSFAYSANISQQFLELCRIAEKSLPEDADTVMCNRCDATAPIEYTFSDIEQFVKEKDFLQICTDKTVSKQEKCKCKIVKKSPLLKQSCKRTPKGIMYTDPFAQADYKMQEMLFPPFLNRHKVKKGYFERLGISFDGCAEKVLDSFTEKEKERLKSRLSSQHKDKEQKPPSVEEFINGMLPQVKTEKKVEIDQKILDILKPEKYCAEFEAQVKELVATPRDLLIRESYKAMQSFPKGLKQVLKCLTGESTRPAKGNPLTLLLHNFNRDLVEAEDIINKYIESHPAVQTGNKTGNLLDPNLYGPSGDVVSGETSAEQIQNHRRKWSLHALNVVAPAINDLEGRLEDLAYRLKTESDPNKISEIKEEIDDIRAEKKQLDRVMGEIDSFAGINAKERKQKVAKSDKPKREYNTARAQAYNGNKKKPRKVSKGFNKGFDVKSIFGNQMEPALPANTVKQQSAYTPEIAPSQKEQVAASKTGSKVSKGKGAKRAPSSIKSTSSSFTGGSAKSSGSGGSFVASPSVPTTPRYLFVEEQKEDPKVGAMIDRLSDGDVYAFVNPKQKRVKIYKKQRQTQVFMTEKSVAELNEMGVNIDESRLDSISKITFKDKRIFFHYEDGSYQEGNLLDVRSSKELESLF